jgi:hypothetical protein
MQYLYRHASALFTYPWYHVQWLYPLEYAPTILFSKQTTPLEIEVVVDCEVWYWGHISLHLARWCFKLSLKPLVYNSLIIFHTFFVYAYISLRPYCHWNCQHNILLVGLHSGFLTLPVQLSRLVPKTLRKLHFKYLCGDIELALRSQLSQSTLTSSYKEHHTFSSGRKCIPFKCETNIFILQRKEIPRHGTT